MAFLILVGLGLGIGAAVPIGPVNVEIARRTLARGRLAGMALGFGAVTVDVLFAIATSMGLSRLIDKSRLQGSLGFAGVAICFVIAGFSFYAAWRAWKHGVADEKVDADNNAAGTIGGLAGDYAVGFAMTGLNIYTWVWWLAVPGLVAQRGVDPARDLPMTCIGVFMAASGWVVVFTTIINRLRRFAGRSWHIGADLGGGVMLLGFGFWALWRLLERPL